MLSLHEVYEVNAWCHASECEPILDQLYAKYGTQAESGSRKFSILQAAYFQMLLLTRSFVEFYFHTQNIGLERDGELNA
jgi:hypothetical protein